MLVTFSCPAYADITMFGDVALKLLRMMGHSDSIPGALLAEDTRAALQRLQTAVAAEPSLPQMETLKTGTTSNLRSVFRTGHFP